MDSNQKVQDAVDNILASLGPVISLDVNSDEVENSTRLHVRHSDGAVLSGATGGYCSVRGTQVVADINCRLCKELLFEGHLGAGWRWPNNTA